MPALIKTEHTATITWLGRVADRQATLRAEPLNRMTASFTGIADDAHGGLTRPSCSRVVSQYPRGTEIRNVRQFAIVSAEELAQIAATMGLQAIDPGWLGSSVVIEGIPDFSHVPPSSRLQNQDGTTLTIDMENRPCNLPAAVIEENAPGFGRAFKQAARGLRGVTAWVEREGPLAIADRVTLHVPDQPVWQGG